MNDLRKAAQLMLDSVEQMLGGGEWYCARERADALRAALQDEGKPVAWVSLEAWKSGKYWPDDCFSDVPCAENVPLYTTPPQRPLLTDEELEEIYKQAREEAERIFPYGTKFVPLVARAIERKVRGEE
jgi:hypothetical protein